jgi:hypothetical protein
MMRMETYSENLKRTYRVNFPSLVRLIYKLLYPDSPLPIRWDSQAKLGFLIGILRGEYTRAILNCREAPDNLVLLLAFALFYGMNLPEKNVVLVVWDRRSVNRIKELLVKLLNSTRFRSIFQNVPLKIPKWTLSLSNTTGISIVSVGQQIGADPIDLLLIGDLVPATKSDNDEILARANLYIGAEVMPQVKQSGICAVLMSRRHCDDLTALLLREPDRWHHRRIPAVANEDESWLLPDGTLHTRKPLDAIDPENEGERDLLDELERIGASQFWSRIQQAPRRPDKLERGGFMPILVGPDYQKWGDPVYGGCLWRHSSRDVVLTDVFGYQLDPIIPDGARVTTQEEWEEACDSQQTDLLRRCAMDK